mmetsp:Transcript_39444/g.73543  ORF Transcript_39444/g.73543 Transcript_39444/m.73543 type:complete len:189 (-) Transcript_39444:59-625(-)
MPSPRKTGARSPIQSILSIVLLGVWLQFGSRIAAPRSLPWAVPSLRGAWGTSSEEILLNSTYSNALGTCQVVVWRDGRMEFELYGFGTVDTTGKMLRDCTAAMAKLDDSVACTALVDMRCGVGCSPLAVPVISRFMQEQGPRIEHSAVLGPRPLMALAQTIANTVRQKGVAFFIDRGDAERWCRIPHQ